MRYLNSKIDSKNEPIKLTDSLHAGTKSCKLKSS